MLRSAMTYAQPDYLASPEERYVTLPRKTIRRHVSKISFDSASPYTRGKLLTRRKGLQINQRLRA